MFEHDIVLVRFEQGGREFCHLRFHPCAGHMDRHAAHGLRTAAEASNSLFDDAGVAVVDGDVFDWDAKLVGQHLGEGSFVALPVR